MEPDILNTVLSDNPIERVIILLLAAAVIALYLRANHLADQRVSDIQGTVATTNAAMAETTRVLDLLATRLENLGRLIALLIPGRSGEELQAARQRSERRLAELREQSRRLRRII
ncbi:hypothetical protein [Roseitranquillus sediminis]|uniref:hypothetical protein n=1 Tax=Roseitranquillus sediminis TaxID=2809051 RepID=UPI001D0C00B9|nr:hypothetical protein [Roseitranquillus sediminis]MBM9595985.1 hypothetical protein [Roseitranquillus sediminis]